MVYLTMLQGVHCLDRLRNTTKYVNQDIGLLVECEPWIIPDYEAGVPTGENTCRFLLTKLVGCTVMPTERQARFVRSANSELKMTFSSTSSEQ